MSSPSRLKIQHLVASQRPGYSLAQAFYKDQAVYQQEINQIFLKHWLYAGHVSQIPQSGDYFTLEFDTESVIVARNSRGEVKAHMNVCRHRGSRICLESSGSQKSLTCPYHAWNYSLDGELLSARNMPEGFDRSQHGLHKVQVAVLHGLIFICLSDHAPSLDALAHDLAEVFVLFGFDTMKLAEKKSYRIPANWKLAVENYQECYHCAPSHPEFAQIHAMAKAPQVFQTAKANFHRDHQHNPKFKAFNRYFDLAEAGQEGYQYDRNPLLRGSVSGSVGGKAVAPLLGDISDYDGGASELMVGPLSYFLLYDDHMVGYRFFPLSVDECICDVSWFVHEKAVAGKDYQLDQLTWLWDVTTQADKKIIMNNQQGVDSRYYQSGPLSDMEHFQQHFLRWYLQALNS
jgi:phenylpropionate dioxygenase-like ring-hydroxylating dioxygenase large terminal subunit